MESHLFLCHIRPLSLLFLTELTRKFPRKNKIKYPEKNHSWMLYRLRVTESWEDSTQHCNIRIMPCSSASPLRIFKVNEHSIYTVVFRIRLFARIVEHVWQILCIVHTLNLASKLTQSKLAHSIILFQSEYRTVLETPRLH